MDLRRMNTISIIVVIAFIVLFFSVQLSLTERIYEDMKISPSIISHYEVPDSDGKNYSLGIPSAYLDEEVTTSKNDVSVDGIQIQATAIPKSEVTTIHPTRPAPFNPVGIPFFKNKWYRLFRYYQSKKNETNTELIQSLQQAKGSLNSWMIFQQEEVDVLFIRQGCIDIQNRKVIAFDPPLSETAPKQRLRSVVSEESLSPLSFAGFDSYSIAEAKLPLPTRLSSTSDGFTWVIATPPLKDGKTECVDAFLQYVPLFLQTMRPFLPNQVGFFIDRIRSVNITTYFSIMNTRKAWMVFQMLVMFKQSSPFPLYHTLHSSLVVDSRNPHSLFPSHVTSSLLEADF